VSGYIGWSDARQRDFVAGVGGTLRLASTRPGNRRDAVQTSEPGEGRFRRFRAYRMAFTVTVPLQRQSAWAGRLSQGAKLQ
jgi:hypothetical protein